MNDPHFIEPADYSTARCIELLGQARAAARGDKKLESFIDAALQLNESGKLNQQLGDLLDESPAQVAIDKRRFQRRINSHG